MSMCNIIYAPESVTMYTDTMIYGATSMPTRLSDRPKARMSEAGQFIWAFRGVKAIGDIISRPMAEMEGIESAERAAAELMQGLGEEHLGPHGLELHLAGWSDLLGQMRVIRLLRDRDEFSASVLEPGTYLHPCITPKVAVPADVSDAAMRRLAMAQWKVSHMRDLRMCLGGSLWRTTVSPGGVTQEIVDLFPDYDQHAAELGDPLAAAVARFREGERTAA